MPRLITSSVRHHFLRRLVLPLATRPPGAGCACVGRRFALNRSNTLLIASPEFVAGYLPPVAVGTVTVHCTTDTSRWTTPRQYYVLPSITIANSALKYSDEEKKTDDSLPQNGRLSQLISNYSFSVKKLCDKKINAPLVAFRLPFDRWRRDREKLPVTAGHLAAPLLTPARPVCSPDAATRARRGAVQREAAREVRAPPADEEDRAAPPRPEGGVQRREGAPRHGGLAAPQVGTGVTRGGGSRGHRVLGQ